MHEKRYGGRDSSLAHNSESGRGYKNSAQTSSPLLDRKSGASSVGGIGAMTGGMGPPGSGAEHLYAFVGNNPCNAIDMLGLDYVPVNQQSDEQWWREARSRDWLVGEDDDYPRRYNPSPPPSGYYAGWQDYSLSSGGFNLGDFFGGAGNGIGAWMYEAYTGLGNATYRAMGGIQSLWDPVGGTMTSSMGQEWTRSSSFHRAYETGSRSSQIGWDTGYGGTELAANVGLMAAPGGLGLRASGGLTAGRGLTAKPPVGFFGPLFDNRAWGTVRADRNAGLLNTVGRDWTWEHFFIRQKYFDNSQSSWLRGLGNSYANTFLRIPRGLNSSLGNDPVKRWLFRGGVIGGAGASGVGGYMLGNDIFDRYFDPYLDE